MNRTNALAAALQSVALSLWAFPALVLAQAQAPAQPAPGDAGARTGGAAWLWIIAALVVVAVVWWALTARRRRESPR